LLNLILWIQESGWSEITNIEYSQFRY
jgi:hypothetical protein